MSGYVPPRPDLPDNWASQPLPPLPPPPPPSGATDLRPKATWKWWHALLVFMGGIVVTAFLFAIVLPILPRGVRFYAAAIVGEFVPLALLFLWLQRYHRNWKQVMGLPKEPLREIGAGIVGGLAIYGVASFGVGVILTDLFNAVFGGQVRTPEQIPGNTTGPRVLFAAILVVVAAPLAEEFFFRGCLFTAIRARRPYWLAAIASSVLFGLAHYGPDAQSGLAGAFLLVSLMFTVGFGLSYVYEKRRNIVASMVAHATFNIIGLIFILSR